MKLPPIHKNEIAYAKEIGLEIISPREYAKKYLNITDEKILIGLEVVYELFSYPTVHEHFMTNIESVIAEYGKNHICVVADEYNAFLIEI